MMASIKPILCVGLTCLDMVQTVAHFPQEDSDQRSEEARWQRGGNASNNCTVLSQLGIPCEFLGTMGSDLTLQFMLDDFTAMNIATDKCSIFEGATCPISTVIVNEQNAGSRTIIHHPGTTPEVHIKTLIAIDCNNYSWIHFEGRNVKTLTAFLSHLLSFPKRPQISVELEKPRRELDRLLPLADVIFLGQDYAENARGWVNGESAVKAALKDAKVGATVICAWGAEGAWAISGRSESQICHSPAYPPEQVLDTLGAGDTFVAALIACLSHQKDLKTSLDIACKLAGKKVGHKGFKGLQDEWKLIFNASE